MRDLGRLHLLQLASPVLPVGGFSYSEGLEVLVQQGRLCSAQAVQAWLEAELQWGQLALETASLRLLMAGWRRWQAGGSNATVQWWDQWLLAQRESPELRQQQRQMGRSLLQLLHDLGWPTPRCGPDQPLGWTAAWAWGAVCLELEPLAALEGYLFSWMATQLSAAVRLVPLGPTEAQRLQLALAPSLARRAEELWRSAPHRLHGAGIGASLAQLHHAELYSRLFRS